MMQNRQNEFCYLSQGWLLFPALFQVIVDIDLEFEKSLLSVPHII